MSALVNIDAGAVIGALRDGLDRIFPSPEEKARAQAILDQIASHKDDAQTELDKIEAASSSIFVAGWRPFIGWVCGVALAWTFFVAPLFTFALNACGVTVALPVLDGNPLFSLVVTMLGNAGLRTFEKIRDAAGNH